jgi:hypothetical protein
MNRVTPGSIWRNALGEQVIALNELPCASPHCKESMDRTNLCNGYIWHCLNTSTFLQSWCCVGCEIFYHKPKDFNGKKEDV